MAQIDIATHDAGREPDVRGVGATHRLIDLVSVVVQDAHDGAEDLLPDDDHLVRAVREHGRTDPVALLEGVRQQATAATVQGLGPAAQQRRLVLLDAAADVRDDLVAVGRAAKGAEVGRGIVEVAGPDEGHLLQDGGLELALHGARHEHARPVGADLAGAVEVGHHGDVGGDVDVRVGQDHQGALAAELHGDVLHVAGGGAGDFPPRADLAREADLRDGRVARQGGTDIAGAVDDVEHAVGDAGLAVDVGEVLGVERGELARLVDHAVAGGEARGRLPQRDLDGVVPGADAGADAEGLLGRDDGGGGPEPERLPVQAAARDQVREVLEHVGARDDVDGGRLGERLPRVEGLDARQGVVVAAQERHRLLEDSGPLYRRGAGPRGEGGLRRLHRRFDGGRGRRVDLADGRCCRWVDGCDEGAAGGRIPG